MSNEKRVCENCNRVMKQQFIGLKHCKCGTSWKKGEGYFQRTPDMVFALERRKKGKGPKTKQVPVIRYKDNGDDNVSAICNVCKGDMSKVDGCKPSPIRYQGKQYTRVKVGDASDFYEDGNAKTRCTDCGAKHGYYHHDGCDCERCPVCDGLLCCGCK